MSNRVDVSNTSSSCVEGSNRRRRDKRRDEPSPTPPPCVFAPTHDPGPRRCAPAAAGFRDMSVHSLCGACGKNRQKAGRPEEEPVRLTQAGQGGSRNGTAARERTRPGTKKAHSSPSRQRLCSCGGGGRRQRRSPTTRFHSATIGRLVVVQFDPRPILDFIIPMAQQKRSSDNQTRTQRGKKTNAQLIRNDTNNECDTSTGHSHIESA